MDIGAVVVKEPPPEKKRGRKKKTVEAGGITVPLPASTLMDGVKAGTTKNKKMSELLRDAFNLTPAQALEALKTQNVETLGELVALQMAVKASTGNTRAFELVTDRMEGKPGVVVDVQQNLVENLIRAFVLDTQTPVAAKAAARELPATAAIDAEEVDDDDKPLGTWARTSGAVEQGKVKSREGHGMGAEEAPDVVRAVG